MKVFAVFVLVLAGLIPCYADTWDVQASCNPQYYQQTPVCATPAVINAVFTTTLETGYFYDPANDESYYGQASVVTGIAGTFDGAAMQLVPGNGWMQTDLPEDVAFTEGGNEWVLFFDGYFYLQPIPWVAPWTQVEYLNWSAVDVPEPPLFWLLLTALSFLGLSRWAQLSLRKYSAR